MKKKKKQENTMLKTLRSETKLMNKKYSLMY